MPADEDWPGAKGNMYANTQISLVLNEENKTQIRIAEIPRKYDSCSSKAVI